MRSFIAFLLFGFYLVFTVGCGSGGGGTGGLDVRITDAPFPVSCFAAASIDVDRIEIQPTGSQGNGGWITVTATAQTFDLLDLAGGISQTAAFAELPTGRYHKVRLHISNATLSWADGFQRSFTIPSGRIDIDPKPMIVIVAGVTSHLALDFDLSRSFVQAGTPTTDCSALKAANKILFNPVIRATNPDASGVVEGVVSVSGGGGLAGATVAASDGVNPEVTTITSDGSHGEPVGHYAMLLDPGAYTLTFDAPGHVSQTASVTIETGKVKTVDATLP